MPINKLAAPRSPQVPTYLTYSDLLAPKSTIPLNKRQKELKITDRPPNLKGFGNDVKIIKDPLYGEIKFDLSTPQDKLIYNLINTPEFKKLALRRQLGLLSGANGELLPATRFEHSIGTYSLVCKMIANVKTTDLERMAVKAAALLHDLGHGPFSHSSERIVKYHHEDVTRRLIGDIKGDIYKLLEAYDSELPSLVLDILNKEHRLSAFVSSGLDADRLDYLPRDSFSLSDPKATSETLLRDTESVANAVLRVKTTDGESPELVFDAGVFYSTMRLMEARRDFYDKKVLQPRLIKREALLKMFINKLLDSKYYSLDKETFKLMSDHDVIRLINHFSMGHFSMGHFRLDKDKNFIQKQHQEPQHNTLNEEQQLQRLAEGLLNDGKFTLYKLELTPNFNSSIDVLRKEFERKLKGSDQQLYSVFKIHPIKKSKERLYFEGRTSTSRENIKYQHNLAPIGEHKEPAYFALFPSDFNPTKLKIRGVKSMTIYPDTSKETI